MKIQKILFLATMISLTGFQSCYKDLGNYDYRELNEIEISGIESEYVVEQFETLSITPILSQSLYPDESKLEFLWHMYPYNRVNETDTLSFSRNLNDVIGAAPASYTVIYRVTDSETGVFTKYTFKITTINSYTNGLIVLSEVDKKANVTFLNSAGHLYQDVFKNVNGSYAGKNPVGLGHLFNKDEQGIVILCDDERGGVLTDILAFIQYAEYKDMFWFLPEDPNPSGYVRFNSSSWDAMIENGELNYRQFYSSAVSKYETPLRKGTNLYPVMFSVNYRYKAVYDNAAENFFMVATGPTLSVYDVISLPDSLFNPADMGMQLLCGGDGFKGDGFGLFFDDADNHFYALHFDVNYYKILPLKKIDVTASPGIEKATTFALSTLSPQFFYAVDNKLYCLDAFTNVTTVVYSFEPDVTIDYIELEKDENDRVMYIGTSSPSSKDKIGSFHIMNVEINGTTTLSESHFNVAGKIVDFLYKEVI